LGIYHITVGHDEDIRRVDIWDTFGNEIAMTTGTYDKVDVFIVCFSISCRKSFMRAETHWIPEIRRLDPKAKIILVATKYDLRDDLLTKQLNPITFEEGLMMAWKNKAINYIECSSLIQKNLRLILTTIIDIHDCSGDKVESKVLGDVSEVKTEQKEEISKIDQLKSERPISCLVVGDEGVGKTSLLMSLGDYKSTERINFFDTKNDHETKSLIRNCILDLFMVCFSLISPSSFDSAENKWIPQIRYYHPKAKIIIVGTKLDMRDDEEIIKELSEKKSKPITYMEGRRVKYDSKENYYIECSSLCDKNLDYLLSEIFRISEDRERDENDDNITMMKKRISSQQQNTTNYGNLLSSSVDSNNGRRYTQYIVNGHIVHAIYGEKRKGKEEFDEVPPLEEEQCDFFINQPEICRENSQSEKKEKQVDEDKIKENVTQDKTHKYNESFFNAINTVKEIDPNFERNLFEFLKNRFEPTKVEPTKVEPMAKNSNESRLIEKKLNDKVNLVKSYIDEKGDLRGIIDVSEIRRIVPLGIDEYDIYFKGEKDCNRFYFTKANVKKLLQDMASFGNQQK
jgi:GTPase SAR1 family protein